MSEPISILEKFPWLKYLMHGLGGGTGVLLAYAGIDAVKQRPEFLQQLANPNVLLFATLIVVIVIFDRRMDGFMQLHARSVKASEEQAAAMKVFAAKDDERARENEILLDHVARNNERILDILQAKKPASGSVPV